MEPNLKLSKKDGDLVADPSTYRRLIGELLCLTITRPYLSFLVNRLSQFLAAPCISHLQEALSLGQGMFFPSNSSIQVKAFSNSDWAACPDTR